MLDTIEGTSQVKTEHANGLTLGHLAFHKLRDSEELVYAGFFWLETILILGDHRMLSNVLTNEWQQNTFEDLSKVCKKADLAITGYLVSRFVRLAYTNHLSLFELRRDVTEL